MKYLMVLFVFGILWKNTIARGLDDPVLHDFERRLVRLEERQFSESENLEHRMLQLETKLGTQGAEKLDGSQLVRNFTEISQKESPFQGMTIFQRLEKVEKNWEKELQEKLEKFEIVQKNWEKELQEKLEKFEKVEKNWEKELEEKLEKFEKAEKNWEKELEEKLEKFSSKYENLSERFAAIEKHVEEQNIKSKCDISEEVEFQVIGKKSYYIENDEKTKWCAAVQKCKEMNAHLVSLQDEEEWKALQKSLSETNSYWTDIHDQSVENEFISESSGRNAPFLMWAQGEPNSIDDIEDCVELKANVGHKMNDIVCNHKKNFICERNI